MPRSKAPAAKPAGKAAAGKRAGSAKPAAVRKARAAAAPVPADVPRREHPGGRPEHVPTTESRQQVESLAGLGLPQAMIGRLVGGISDATVRKYYEAELASGEAKATAKVAQTLFQRATTGNDLGAAIFWLKARAGWREKSEVVSSGKVEVEHSGEIGTVMSAEQRAAVMAAVRAQALADDGAGAGEAS